MTDSQTTEIEKLREALGVAIQVMEIGSDWGAPRYYDIFVPKGWEYTIDPESEEPTWPNLGGIIDACKEVLHPTPSAAQIYANMEKRKIP